MALWHEPQEEPTVHECREAHINACWTFRLPFTCEPPYYSIDYSYDGDLFSMFSCEKHLDNPYSPLIQMEENTITDVFVSTARFAYHKFFHELHLPDGIREEVDGRILREGEADDAGLLEWS